MLLNGAKCEATAFTVSELLRENQQGGWVKLHSPPRLGLTHLMSLVSYLLK